VKIRLKIMHNLETQEMSRSTAASTRQPQPTVDAANTLDERQPAREQAVRERAYAIWEEEGRPDGRDLDHGRRAEQEISSSDEATKAEAP
jgi:hypothetical protein